jgi:hypothetical protein
MDTLMEVGVLALGLLLRIGIPAVITVVLIFLFTRLDARWQVDALTSAQQRPVLARNTGCWKIHGCSEDKMKNCPAAAQRDLPCWQVFRSKNGVMQERCIGCQVFREAPIPINI